MRTLSVLILAILFTFEVRAQVSGQTDASGDGGGCYDSYGLVNNGTLEISINVTFMNLEFDESFEGPCKPLLNAPCELEVGVYWEGQIHYTPLTSCNFNLEETEELYGKTIYNGVVHFDLPFNEEDYVHGEIKRISFGLYCVNSNGYDLVNYCDFEPDFTEIIYIDPNNADEDFYCEQSWIQCYEIMHVLVPDGPSDGKGKTSFLLNNEILEIKFSGENVTKAKILLFDYFGNQVSIQGFTSKIDNRNYQLNIAKLRDGNFIVITDFGDGTSGFSFVNR